MPRFKAKNKNSILFVKAKLHKDEQLVEHDLSMVSQGGFRGLLKPVKMKRNLLEYTGPQGSSLSDYLKQQLTGYEFHFILAQIVRLERTLTSSLLPIKHLIMDLRYIFINPYTKELQFIYLPLFAEPPRVDVRELMETIILQWRPASEEDMQYPARFLSLLRSQREYMPEQILAFIKQYDTRISEQLRKTQTSMSGSITNKQADYMQGRNAFGGSQPVGEETSLLGEECPEDTALLENPGSNVMNVGNKAGIPQTHAAPQWDEETGLLDAVQFPQWNEETGLLDTEPSLQGQEETGLLESNGFAEMDLFNQPNGALPTSEETGLLTDVFPQPSLGGINELYPYLIRRSMNERISVNKPVFRIGKERSYVDCFISNNGAISRSHADIIKRGNRYFICDRNSTNKTFLNGCVLTPENEVEIFDGDILQLANEEFEFHTH